MKWLALLFLFSADMSARPVVTVQLPPLHPAQLEIVKSPARFRVVSAGRRFGKGHLVINEAFARASRGKFCRFVAQSYASDGYQSAWRYAANIASQIPGVTTHLQKRWFDLSAVGGGWVQFRTAEEPDGLRGEGIDFVAFDEAAHIPQMEMLWEQCVRASLMDRQGGAWFISTPKGFNYFNTLHAKAGHEPGWASFQFPTESNPHIAPEEIATLRKSLPALVARQEIDAEFVSLAGALFKRENVHILEREPEGVAWVRSWDTAATTNTTSDYTAGARVGLSDDGTFVVAHIVRDRLEWPDAVRLIGNTARTDGQSIRQGIEVVGTNVGVLQTIQREPTLLDLCFERIAVLKDKLTRALPLVARSEQGKFAIVRGNWNQTFLDELGAFPEGAHDDMVDACSGGMTMLAGSRAEIILV